MLINEIKFLQLLNGFTKNYIHYRSIKDIVKFAISTMNELPDLNKIIFYQLDQDSFQFEFLVANHENCEADLVFNFLTEKNVIVKTLSEVENSFIYDDETNEYYMCIPILSFDGIIGILIFSSSIVNFEENQVLIDHLSTASSIIGLALNSLMSSIDKEHFKGMQDQIIAMETIELKKREHHLKLKMNQLTTNLNRSIPHEIRTPFLHVIGLSDMLLKHPEIESLDDNVEIKDIINDLNLAAKRLNSVLDKYIIYANLVTKSFSTEDIRIENSYYSEDVDSILFELVNEMAYKFSRIADIVVNVEPATVVGSPSMINILFYEIIDNAFKFSSEGTKVKISSKNQDDYLIVTISDHGCGMTNEEVKEIGPFVQFNRAQMEQQGLGLGLAIAIKILAILNGDIDFNSKKGIYTEVKVKLKKFQIDVE